MQYTEEQIQDVKERVDKFNEKVAELQKELEVSLIPEPYMSYTPAGFTINVNVKIADTKYLPKQEDKKADDLIS